MVEERKPAKPRKASTPRKAPSEQAGQPPEAGPAQPQSVDRIALDETYSELRDDNRVVMRHNIALNLESFRAASEEFDVRQRGTYPALQEVAAPFLSVVIPTYNGGRHLPTVLDAVGRQTFRDFETIVVDDASTDGSPALVEQGYPAARLIVNRSNAGFVQACNTGAAAARGRFVVLLNNDTEPEPTWLAELARAVVAHPRAAIVTSKLLLYDRRDTLHTAGDLLGVDGIPRNRGVWEIDRGQYYDAPEIFSGCGGATAYRRDVWQALGGFDDDFWMYLEDVDFGFRARLLGWEAVFAPAARVYHRLSASGGDELASFYVGRNTIWVVAKNMPRSLLRRHWQEILGAQARVAVDALLNIRGRAAQERLRGQMAGILGLPQQLQKRRQIQPRRQIEDADMDARLVDEWE